MIRSRLQMSLHLCKAAVLLFFCLSSLTANSKPAPKSVAQKFDGFDVLQAVAHATRYREYSGKFTYEYDGKIDTVAISHTIKDNIERETITHLSGKRKQVTRQAPLSFCQSAGGFLLIGGALPLLNGKVANLANHYQFVNRGMERIADRDAVVVQMVPRDIYRYGMVLGVDKQSGLLSKVVVTEGSNKVMERIQFVSMEVSQADPNLYTPPDKKPDCKLEATQTESPLRPSWVPDGFVLAKYDYDKVSGHMETYTDGLSAFTLFVSPQKLSSDRLVSRRGATVTMLTKIIANKQTYTVTVVGEIPAVTAHRMTQSLVLFESPAS